MMLRPLILGLKDSGTHIELPTICDRLGLPSPDGGGSKRERMQASFDALPDSGLVVVAQAYLRLHCRSARERTQIEEILWSDDVGPSIPKRFRRELARALSAEDLYLDADRFDELLERLWILDEFEYLGPIPSALRDKIKRHIHDNPGDWSPEKLFDELGAYECSDKRFRMFLEGLASADVRPDEAEQRRWVALANDRLRLCGAELREVATDGGYPAFAVVAAGARGSGRPKNVIFASPVKPDLRLRDAVNNDIEIVTHADEVLVYDRSVGPEGLRWQDLQTWWADREGIDAPDEAKRTLYHRLLAAIPKESPPQILLFKAFFKAFKSQVPSLPALLPEVWLHWDHKTVAERGAEALTRFRMDFLLLLPFDVRIVVEVDGKHHYADAAGRASPERYATMMSADRELRLAGYEVYRFGAVELTGDDAEARVQEFFVSLLARHRIRLRSA
jgi:very-short-patch-repair endonuclease